ncbi:MAG: hypothetical protein U0835_13120 [Isosphaeraceae bacterium]
MIDVSNPGRFRGTKALRDDFRRFLGEGAAFHIPKWGASHVRGSLRADDGRGNKKHLIEFINILNAYTEGEARLLEEYKTCLRLHHDFWEGFGLEVSVQPEDPFQTRLFELLDLPSYGRVQQGVVYSTLRRHYGGAGRVTTKKTFAADAQSSTSGEMQKGDVQVRLDGLPTMALEVKDAVVDEAVWERVKQTHGSHDYALFLLAKEYRPSGLQRKISNQRQTFALRLGDFLLTLIFMSSCREGKSPGEVLDEIVEIYNTEFCGTIENDHSLAIKARRPDE